MDCEDSNIAPEQIRFLMRLLTLILLFITPMTVFGQGRFGFTVGYGVYGMKDLKNIDDEVPQSFPADLRTVESFPPYWNFEESFTYQTRRAFFWGLVIAHGSTGGRQHYSDYSGFVHYDQLLRYLSFTSSVGWSRKIPSKNMLIGFDLRPGIIFSKLDLISRYEIASLYGNDRRTFNSTNLALQPTANISKRFGYFGLDVYTGININVVRGKFNLSDDKEQWLVTSTYDPVKAGWTGLRFGIGVSLYLSKKVL